MKKIIVCTASIVLLSVSYTKPNGADKVKNEINVIKFMNSIGTYSVETNEISFWKFPEEHAKLDISIDDNGNFLEEVKKLPKNDGRTFNFFNYAFIIKTKGVSDTIYADTDLKTYLFKEKGKFQARYDEKGFWAEQLRHKYSFFKACW
ncbi:hypothetical protein J7E50_12740 [Pedobacter sp. ISL-68]|uniref:hypothetical protein n=1 Tax=unclassified Pedobacter TaxID=2628915 RepID=UPI001BE8337D|nr:MULTISPECIES: hypothetical protein [unclassified Pedobacter]MBT2561704.1 hypothetical protein [Pedobacter sp. ISL-64]MBT2591092.1 hypothetical protein [Pedobacter sp. ISL-68]